jgi:hypothetical protein
VEVDVFNGEGYQMSVFVWEYNEILFIFECFEVGSVCDFEEDVFGGSGDRWNPVMVGLRAEGLYSFLYLSNPNVSWTWVRMPPWMYRML